MAHATVTPNYTLGRGEVWFSPFIAGGQVPEGFRYMGNTPELNLTIDQETLDHFSSDFGIREKDDSVPLEVNRTGTMICDDINKENVALFFFGTAAKLTVALSLALQDDTIVVKQGLTYQIGRTAANPTGARGLATIIVKDVTDVTTYILGTDYEEDETRGLVTIIVGGAITDDDLLHITYDQLAYTADQVISGAEPVEGSIKYIEYNPRGQDHDIEIPLCRMSPNGDLSLKGDDWRQIPFNIEILKPVGSEAIYRNGLPLLT